MKTERKIHKTERKLFRGYSLRFLLAAILIFTSTSIPGPMFYVLLTVAAMSMLSGFRWLYWHLHILDVISVRKENSNG